ncbi:MAG: hypothetical protein UDM02_07415 [Blautia sp.]|nr:hypothetical protein [Blautia sp.]
MRNLFVTGRKTAPGELMLKIIGMAAIYLVCRAVSANRSGEYADSSGFIFSGSLEK